ncbi:MAG: superoxide dismutase [Ni] [Acidobacteriota bacterium]
MRSTKTAVFALVVLAASVCAPAAFAHCQVPCGIYGDKDRFTEMREHVKTIEKSMDSITAEGKKDAPNWNQLVRWVNNKEDHADKLTEIVTYYFLTQRIKPAKEGDSAGQAKYLKDLSLLHGMMLHCMKSKQTTDTSHVDALRSLIDQFEHSYFGEDHQ